MRELDHPVRGAELALTARGHERDPIHRNLADHVPARQSAFEAFPHQLAGTQPLCDLMKCPLAEMGGIREHVDATGGTDQRLRRYQAGQGSVQFLPLLTQHDGQFVLAIHVARVLGIHLAQLINRLAPLHAYKCT